MSAFGNRSAELLSVAALVAVTIVLRVNVPPVYLWDEARLAINALEMMSSGNPLLVTFDGQPDLWNTRPPLAAWLMAISMALFGINELALRLPAVIAGAATVFAVYGFTRQVSGSGAAGVLAAVILVGTGGYIEVHVARTADYDALLVLFSTLATFSLFGAIQAVPGTRVADRYIYGTAFFLALAIFTKGTAGLLCGAGYAAYLIFSRRMRLLIRCRAVAIAGVALVLSIGAFLAARELIAPGYLAAAGHDQIDRFTTAAGGNDGPWHYHLLELLWPWQHQLLDGINGAAYIQSAFPWSWLVPVAAWAAITSRGGEIPRATLFLSSVLGGLLFVVSIAATKSPWYVAPAYPLIAVIVALGIHQIALWTRSSKGRRAAAQAFTVLVGAFALGFLTVGLNVWKTEQEIASASASREQRLAHFLKHLVRHGDGDQPVRVLADALWTAPVIRDGKLAAEQPYDAAAEFYIRLMRRSGADVRFVPPGYPYRSGETLVGCGRSVRTEYRNLRESARVGECFALTSSRPTRPR